METSPKPLEKVEPEPVHKPQPELPKNTKHLPPQKTLKMKTPSSQPQSQTPKPQEPDHPPKSDKIPDKINPPKQAVSPIAMSFIEEFKEYQTPPYNRFIMGELSDEEEEEEEEVEEKSS